MLCFSNPDKEVTNNTGLDVILSILLHTTKVQFPILPIWITLEKGLVVDLSNQVTDEHNFVVQILEDGFSLELRPARNFRDEFDRDVKVVVRLHEYLKSN